MRLGRLFWIARVLVLQRRFHGAFRIDGFGLAVGRNVSLSIEPPGSIRIGARIQLRDGCELAAAGGRIDVAENVFFNRNCTVVSRAAVEIGRDCIFGPNVAVYDHDHGFADPAQPIWAQPVHAEPVRIGDDVWLGANVVVTRGATIGDRTVIGANAVVTGDLPGGGLYVGNPARRVRDI